MAVKLIAENILTSAHFLSATEQEGEFWGQPQPDTANIGKMKLAAGGTPANYTYSGTATSNGAAGGTTVIDSKLSAFGDKYFIGATVTMTGGTCNGESKTVTDFAQSTGTLTTGAFTAQIDSGDTFTLTVDFKTRDFWVEIDESGDFKTSSWWWSHDGGTTVMNRDNPLRATWDGKLTVEGTYADSTYLGKPSLLVHPDGTWYLFYVETVGGVGTGWAYQTSTDKGLTWTDMGWVTPFQSPAQGNVIELKNGRWLIIANLDANNTRIVYWDEGEHGGLLANLTHQVGPCRELMDGRIATVYEVTATSYVAFRISNDGGKTWSAAVTVISTTNSQNYPDIIQADDGTLVCVFETDQTSLNDYEIKCCRSTDNGATWGSVIDVMNFDANHEYRYPTICKDHNGTLICAAIDTTPAPDEIAITYSTDNGATWYGTPYVVTTSADAPGCVGLSLVEGHLLVCTYVTAGNDAIIVRAGYWEDLGLGAVSYQYTNGDEAGTHLICGAKAVWKGYKANASDEWTFGCDYDYAMDNLIEDSPSRSWRSEQDNIACSVVIDLGAATAFYADGAAFFGCNMRTLKFQMNASDSWGSPSVDESVSFDLGTGACDNNPALNEIQDTSLLAGYKDHQLKGCKLVFTSGSLDTSCFEITDNVSSYIFIDGDASTATTNDTFAIFQDHIAVTFSAGVYRYMRITIAAQHTAENYYQIGSMVVGRTVTLDDPFAMGYGKDHEYGVTVLETPAGGLIPVEQFGRKRRFRLDFIASVNGRKQVLALMDYLKGKNLCLILDSATLTDCYLVKLKGAIKQTHQIMEYLSLEAEFEEVL